MGAGCCCGCCFGKTPNYRNGSPSVSGGKVTACFPDGGLFKIEKGKKWYYYNDQELSVARIRADFMAGSEIALGGQSVLERHGTAGACTVVATVAPLETIELVTVKKLNGYKTDLRMDPYTESEKEAMRQRARLKSNDELNKMRALAKGSTAKDIHHLLKLARTKGKMFVDLEFPPTQNSLVRPGLDNNKQQEFVATLQNFCWRRPQDYLPSSWKGRIVLFDGIDATDINQGQLGDCYFLCACAALTEFPANIECLFKNKHCCCIERSEHKSGAWRVTLNVHGWWQTYIIDSYLPSSHLLPSFARNRKNPGELWVSLLEKAYAKAYGSYLSIAAGFAWQAFEDLTGYPTYDFDELWRTAITDTTVRQTLFKKLEAWSKEGHLVSIGTPASQKLTIQGKRLGTKAAEELCDKAGLAPGHAYSVLDVKHFPLHKLCLLKVRNPWGNDVEWSGDWSDESDLWSKFPLVKLACHPEKKADGIFWIEWKDVIKFFDTGCVCYRRGHWYSVWHDYRVLVSFHEAWPDIAFEIVAHKKNFSAYFSLHQKDKRGLPANDPDTTYAGIMLSLCEGDIGASRQTVIANSGDDPEEPTTEYVFQMKRSVALYHQFEKGKRYFIVPRRSIQAGTNAQKDKKYVLSMTISRRPREGTVDVNIVRLERNCDVFSNFKSFAIDKLTEVTSVYQEKHGQATFKTKKGSNFMKGSKEISAKYENMM